METPDTSAEEATEELAEDATVDTEAFENEAVDPEENDESCDCGCCACGDTAEPEASTPKKKCKVVTPIIIAAVCFALVAAMVFGGVTLYNAFFGTSLKGIWVEEGYEESGIYFEFDDKGNVYLRGGGISYFGTYETATYDLSKDSDIPEFVTTLADSGAVSGKVNVLKTDFYMFGMYGSQYVYTMDSVDGEKVLNMQFVDSSGAVSQWNFTKSKLPEFTMDPTVITNASADEAGVKTLEVDKNILGTWSETDYGTYTFYDDGTAHFETKYQVDQTYQMFYGITMGYGVDLDFKYTVGDGTIYMSVDYFTGESNDGVMTYYLDGKNLVIDGVGYAKVE